MSEGGGEGPRKKKDCSVSNREDLMNKLTCAEDDLSV
jgi:hypothetical protein